MLIHNKNYHKSVCLFSFEEFSFLQLDDSDDDDEELLVSSNIPSKQELPKSSDDLQFHGRSSSLFLALIDLDLDFIPRISLMFLYRFLAYVKD